MTLREHLIKAITALKDQGIETSRLDAQLLMMKVMSYSRTDLITKDDTILSQEQEQAFTNLIQKRLAGHPIAHLIGERDFWNLTLKVTPATLIPRPDTEILVEKAINLIKEHNLKKVLDLGTGTGAIILSLKHDCPEIEATAVDFSEDALTVAKDNASTYNLNVNFLRGSWFEALNNQEPQQATEEQQTAKSSEVTSKEDSLGEEETLKAKPENKLVSQLFDLIVSNPPYIEDEDPHLKEGDVRFEPITALASGKDGLDDIRLITKQAPQHLKQGGYLVFEHGYNQAKQVQQIMAEHGFTQIETIKDYGGNDRVTLGRLTKA